MADKIENPTGAPTIDQTQETKSSKTKVAKFIRSMVEEIIAHTVVANSTDPFQNGRIIVKTATKKIWLQRGVNLPEDAEVITYDEVLLEGKGEVVYTNDVMFGKYNRKQLNDSKIEKLKALGLGEALTL